MKALSDDTAVSEAPLVGEDQVPSTTLLPGRLVGRLAVFLLGGALEKTGVAERPRAVSREDSGVPRADMDAGLTRGATLLLGVGPMRPRRR